MHTQPMRKCGIPAESLRCVCVCVCVCGASDREGGVEGESERVIEGVCVCVFVWSE